MKMRTVNAATATTENALKGNAGYLTESILCGRTIQPLMPCQPAARDYEQRVLVHTPADSVALLK